MKHSSPGFPRGAVLSALALVAILPSLAMSQARDLVAHCTAMTEGDNPYFGGAVLGRLQREILDSPTPDAQISARLQLAQALIRRGEPLAAVDLLTESLAIAQRIGADPGLHTLGLWYLGLAHMQAGEDENCLLHHDASSCILPFDSKAVHRSPEHARKAGDAFLRYLNERPQDARAAWLLNLTRQLSGDGAQALPARFLLPRDALISGAPFVHWRDRAPDLGLDVVDLAGGAAMEDFDGDGLLDIVTSTWDPCDRMKAFRNDGLGRFVDVAKEWNLTDQLGGLNLNHADYDNDGRLDILVLRGAWMLGDGVVRNSLLRNVATEDGMRFLDVTHEVGLDTPSYPTQAASWGDFDGDGDLDLFVGAEATERGIADPSQLFRNDLLPDGSRHFTDIAQVAGVVNLRYTKAAAWGDYDNDGDLDLYVSNFGPNRLYRNDGAGRFTDVAVELEVTAPEAESFATWFFDVDNDGDLDLFVADYRQQPYQVAASYFDVPYEEGQPLLYLNEGGRFREVSRGAGLTRPAMPMGANFGDLDNDGWLDIYLGTGEPDLASLMPNLMYRNTGTRFVDVTFAGGFGHLQKGHGIAFGDLDNDGDQDILHQLGGFYPGDDYANALFENPGAPGHWLTLFFEGVTANRFGVGARVEVVFMEEGRQRSVHHQVGTGGSFGSSSLRLEMGLGAAESIREVRVGWPGSREVQRLTGFSVDRSYRIVQGAAEPTPVDLQRVALGGVGGR